MLENLPVELRCLPQWVCVGPDRAPINPRTGHLASTTDPATWGTFEEARKRSGEVGFVLAEHDPYCIIDLDNKLTNPCTPEELSRHHKILEQFDSYTERSSGGRGYHIIVKGRIPAGVHRDKVEAYSSSRYMICTGDVVHHSPIKDRQPLLDILYGEMSSIRAVLEDHQAVQDDADLVSMAMNAANGDKFNSLCCGDISDYPSQSEADFALLSIFAFYTRDNEQVRRLFRMSVLGKRDKAARNDTYLDRALSKIRAQQPPPVDMQGLLDNVKPLHKVIAPAAAEKQELTFPPGLVGELADYFYQTAIRPVPEIALAAAIALTAGVCGRSYNISGSGLNQYLLLLAKTGSGKEGAANGIDRLISAVRPQIPMVDQFIGPAAFASGQALVKVLNDKPCFVSVLGEFGLTLQQLSDHRANSAQLMLRKVLLDLYTKSGWNSVLRSSVYSDTEKNTKIIQAPSVTLLGESTPESFFDNINSSHIAEGLIPRFSVIEYTGERVARNNKANIPPSAELVQHFIDFVTISLTTTANGVCAPVHLDNHSALLMDAFDRKADAAINGSKLDVEAQLWNRAHLKALKLAALLAVGCDLHRPVVTEAQARWAIAFVTRDVELVTARFTGGNIGQGDSKQVHDLRSAIEGYFKNPTKAVKERFNSLHNAGIIPYTHLSQRTLAVASFRNDRLGATNALKRSVQSMVDSGLLVEIPKATLVKAHNYSGVAYGIGTAWE